MTTMGRSRRYGHVAVSKSGEAAETESCRLRFMIKQMIRIMPVISKQNEFESAERRGNEIVGR